MGFWEMRGWWLRKPAILFDCWPAVNKNTRVMHNDHIIQMSGFLSRTSPSVRFSIIYRWIIVLHSFNEIGALRSKHNNNKQMKILQNFCYSWIKCSAFEMNDTMISTCETSCFKWENIRIQINQRKSKFRLRCDYCSLLPIFGRKRNSDS